MKERGWNQSDLARASKLTRQAISYLLSGKSKEPDNKTFEGLAKAFDVPVEVVRQMAGEIPLSSKEDAWVTDIKHKLSKLSPELRATAEVIIEALYKNEKKGSDRGKK